MQADSAHLKVSWLLSVTLHGTLICRFILSVSLCDCVFAWYCILVALTQPPISAPAMNHVWLCVLYTQRVRAIYTRQLSHLINVWKANHTHPELSMHLLTPQHQWCFKHIVFHQCIKLWIASGALSVIYLCSLNIIPEPRFSVFDDCSLLNLTFI